MSDLTPWRGGIEKSFCSLAERRIDKAAGIEAYGHDRLTELVVHKTSNIDWAIAQRVRSGSILAEVCKRAVEQTLEAGLGECGREST